MRALFLLLSFLWAWHTSAQSLPTALSDTSVTVRSSKSWGHRHRTLLMSTGGALLTAGAGIAAYHWFDKPVRTFSQEKQSAFTTSVAKVVEPFGRAVPLHTTFAVLLTTGIIIKKPKMREATAIALGSFYVNALLTTQLKHTFQRARPGHSVSNDIFEGPNGRGEYTSLPSSHTSNAFAAATAIATVYRDKRWVPPVAYGCATLVGLSRIHDNAHWTSDVIAGAALGFLSAKVSHWAYHQVRNKIKARKVQFFPSWQEGSPIVRASLQF